MLGPHIREQVGDILPLRKGDIGLLPVGTVSLAEVISTLELTLHLRGVDIDNIHLEELLLLVQDQI